MWHAACDQHAEGIHLCYYSHIVLPSQFLMFEKVARAVLAKYLILAQSCKSTVVVPMTEEDIAQKSGVRRG